MVTRRPSPATLQSIAMAFTGLSSIITFGIVGADYSRFAFTLLAGAAWLVVWAAGALEELDPPRRLYFVGFAVAVASVIISTAGARFPALAFTFGGVTGVSAPYWIALLCIMAFSSRVTLGRTTLLALRWQYAWILPVAIIGGVQALLGREWIFAFLNVDYLAAMMLVFAPVALGLAVKYRSQRHVWVAIAGVLWLTVLAAKTLSGLIGLGAQVLFIAMFVPQLLGLGKSVRWVLIITLLVAAAGFLVFGVLFTFDALPGAVDEFVSTNVFGASSATRVEMWRVALSVIRERLITGVGPDAYSFEGQRFVSRELHLLEHYPGTVNSLPFEPHSLMMLLPVDFGLIGVAAALLMAAGWAWGVLSAPFKSVEGRLLRWSFAIGALGFGYACAFIPFPLEFGGSPMMIVGLALVAPLAPRSLPATRRLVRPAWILATLAVLGALVLGVAGVAARADFVMHGVLGSENRGPLSASRVFSQVYFYRFAQLAEKGRLMLDSPDPEAYREFQRAVDTAPEGVRGFAPCLVELVRFSLDQALATGRTDLAWETARLDEAARLSPTLPEIEVERAHLLIAAGDLAGARRSLDAASHWKDSVPAWRRYDELLR